MTASIIDQPGVRSETSLVDRFAEQVCAHARSIAVCTDGYEWTYRQLDAVSNRLARRIADRNPDPRRPVALLMDHDAPLIAAILAVLKAGQSYMVLDGKDAEARRKATFDFSTAELVVADAEHVAQAGRLILDQGNRLIQASEQPQADDFGFATGPLDPDAIACISFTSGTTGEPKGVVHNHRSIQHHCRNYMQIAGIRPEDRVSLVTGCHLVASMSSLWAALLSGATLCPFALRQHGVDAMTEWARRRRITILHTVPAVWRAVNGRIESLRLLRLGGESIYPSDFALFKRLTGQGCRMMAAFSSSETGAACVNILDHQTRIDGANVPLGEPPPGMRVQLRDESGAVVERGQVGRIVVHSEHLCAGYWRSPELTAARFKADPDDPPRRVFDTGDLGRWNEQGSLEHHGRTDDRLKIRGQRVEPGEVEAALLGLPGIRQCAVTGQPDSSGQTQLVAYVAGTTDLQDDGSLRRVLRQSLPDHMIPAVFVRLEQLPQSSGGKIDWLALPRVTGVPLGEGDRQVSLAHRPRDPIEQQLAKIWTKVLGHGAISRDDDFFADRAGTSLQAAAVITRIEQEMGQRLPLSALMQYPTVQSLAEHLSGQVIESAPTPLLLLQQGSTRPLFLMHRGHGGLYGYRQLIASLSAQQTVYGLQSIGLQGEQWPLGTIEAMGRCYADQIERVDPSGPYLLGGICLGGLVAMETAQQLLDRGRQVALLAMIAATHPQMGGRRTGLRDQLSDQWTHFWRLVRWRMWWMLDRLTGRRLRLAGGPKFRRLVTYVNTRARRNHRPRAYPGKIELFVGSYHADSTRVERTLALGRLAQQGMRVHELSGNGVELFIPPAVSELGSRLQACVDEALGASEGRT